MAKPLISVVMPVRNIAVYVSASIDSILGQTFGDLELVILDDASTDGTDEIIQQWARKDNRIRFFQSKDHLGLRSSSNAVVSHSCASIIARMDGDDISLPDRLRQQWEVLRRDEAAVLVGTLADGIDATGRVVRPRDRWRLVKRSNFAPFPHGSVMFRRKAFEEIGGYKISGGRLGEDQDLFQRLADKGKVLVLPDVLYHYRYHVNSASATIGGTNGREASIIYPATPINQVFSLENGPHTLDELYTIGAVRLWAGARPGVLKQILNRKGVRSGRPGLQMLVWATWGELNPASLRVFLRSFIRNRDRLATRMLRNGSPCEWRFEQS